MHKTTLNLYLTATILLLSLTPLAASFIILNDVLKSAVDIGISDETRKILVEYRNNLRKLASLDPDNNDEYRAAFKEISDELFIYNNPRTLTALLQRSYLTYYLILFISVLFIAAVVAILLGKKIAKSYQELYMNDLRKSERLRDLEHFDEWQVLAGKLAHEIKNPLTPIEVMTSSLPKIYDTSDKQHFQSVLETTCETVKSEINKIKGLVNHFSRFSKLPEPHLRQACIIECCERFIENYRNAWENLEFKFTTELKPNTVLVHLDDILLNQCFINLVTNAVEANPGKPDLCVQFSATINISGTIELLISNTGARIPESDYKNIFKMYVTSKQGKENFGLGLPLCRKIILDFGGDIECINLTEGAAFRITLPVINPADK